MLRKGRVNVTGLAALPIALAICLGGARQAAGAGPDLSAAPASEPVTLAGAVLLSEGEAPRLLLSGTGPLSPTVYSRDEGKKIVVDLPNTIVAPGMEPPRQDGRVFDQIEMKAFVELGKPHVLFELSAKSSLDATLATERGSQALAVQFSRRVEVAPAPQEAARIASADGAPKPSSGSESAAVAADQTDQTTVGRDQDPTGSTASTSAEPLDVVKRPAKGRPATRLDAVSTRRTAGGAEVVLKGNGDFGYEAFLLSNPPRYVIDLVGVKNGAAKSQQVASDVVTRVRVSQYKTAPEPVTRVVFDLATGSAPSLLAGAAGMTVSFGSSGRTNGRTNEGSVTAAKESAPAPAVVASVPQQTVTVSKPTEFAASTSPAEGSPSAGSYEKHEVEERREPVVVATSDAGVVTEPASAPEPQKTAPVAEASADRTAPAPTGATPIEAPAPAPEKAAAATEEGLARPVETKVVDAKPVEAKPVETKVVETKPADVKPAEARVAETKLAEEKPTKVSAPPAEVTIASPETKAVAPVKARKRRAPSAEDRSLMEAAEALLMQQQESSTKAKDLQNPYESRTLGSGDKQYTGEPLSLNLKDADIKDTLQKFSELTSLNIVLDPEVSGKVTVSLTDIPWDQALELILKINGLGYILEGNVMRIAPIAKLSREETEKKRLLEAQDNNRPLKTVIQKISYAPGPIVVGTAKTVMTSRGEITLDAYSNTLIIKELPENLPTVLDLIRTLDQPIPQVLIEARIVEATRTFGRNFGVDWSFQGVADAAHGNTTGLIFPNNGSVNGQVSLPSGNQLLRFRLGNVLDTFRLDFALSAAESRGLVKVVSTPRIVTQNYKPASIQSGFQIPVQTTSNNTTTVTYVDATLNLTVTPLITSEGTVIMDIAVTKREPAVGLITSGGGGGNVPLTTRDAKTRLMVKDGGTSVIGGIFKLTSNDSQTMVPGLWKIPLLGNLFKNKIERQDSDELMIFITPRILKN